MDCNQVHMFGMRFSIDVIFLSQSNEIIRCVNSLKPWSFAISRTATHTLELRQGSIAMHDLAKGMKLKVQFL